MGIGVLKSHNCSLNAAQILRFALNFRAITNDSTRWWNALRLGMRYGFLALTPRPLPCCVSEMRRNNSLSADFPRVTAYLYQAFIWAVGQQPCVILSTVSPLPRLLGGNPPVSD
jgi:hypothetical protein